MLQTLSCAKITYTESAQDLGHVVGVFRHFCFRQINERNFHLVLFLLRDSNVVAFQENVLQEDTACKGSGLGLYRVYRFTWM